MKPALSVNYSTYATGKLKRFIFRSWSRSWTSLIASISKLSNNVSSMLSSISYKVLSRFSDAIYLDFIFDEPCKCCGSPMFIREGRGASSISCDGAKFCKEKVCVHGRAVESAGAVRVECCEPLCQKRDDEKRLEIVSVLYESMRWRLERDSIVVSESSNTDNILCAVLLNINGLSRFVFIKNTVVSVRNGALVDRRLRLVKECFENVEADMPTILGNLVLNYGLKFISSLVEDGRAPFFRALASGETGNIDNGRTATSG